MLLSASELQLISDHQPALRTDDSLMNAAVAIILRDRVLPDGQTTTEFLMMQRAFHQDDPWSGQMSFPGGKIESSDIDAKTAAVREVLEEVGIELQSQDYIGQLDDLYGLRVDEIYIVHVSCFVFKVQRPIEITTNYEVADTVWLPFSYLNEPGNLHDSFQPNGASARMPAVMIDADKDQVLWGLSLRVLVGLYELLAWSMNVLTQKEQIELRNMEKRSIKKENLNKRMQDAIDRRKK